MNQRERDDLLQFLQPLLRTRVTDKDFAAEILILEQCARQPDALYLLVQRAITLGSALEVAQARIAEQQGALAAHTVTQDATRDTTLARVGADDRSGPGPRPAGSGECDRFRSGAGRDGGCGHRWSAARCG